MTNDGWRCITILYLRELGVNLTYSADGVTKAGKDEVDFIVNRIKMRLSRKKMSMRQGI
jgi:hypothetical protein